MSGAARPAASDAECVLRPEARRGLTHAPLAFSQLNHWQLYHSNGGAGFLNVASATRLSGRLNLEALKGSIAEVVARHDALRTRIVVDEGIPKQEIDASSRIEPQVDHLGGLDASDREAEVHRRIERLIVEPIDLAVGPLFGVRILQLTQAEHVLLLAVEHIVSDAISLNILLREILTGYARAAQGEVLSIPAVSMQFAEYAAWQRDRQPAWLAKHGAYWNEHLLRCPRVRFPERERAFTATLSGWDIVPLRIDQDMKVKLRTWCRANRTSVALAVFTAYAALVLRWCGVSEAVIRFQGDGRKHPGTQSAVGFFASRLYLRIALSEEDRLVDLLPRITREYCTAYEHDDFSFMETRVPRPGCASNTFFNWIPRGANLFDGPSGEIATSPVTFVNPWFEALDWDNEPMTLLYDGEDEITGGVYFPRRRLSVDTMERFGRNFLAFVDGLVGHPDLPVRDISLA